MLVEQIAIGWNHPIARVCSLDQRAEAIFQSK